MKAAAGAHTRLETEDLGGGEGQVMDFGTMRIRGSKKREGHGRI